MRLGGGAALPLDGNFQVCKKERKTFLGIHIEADFSSLNYNKHSSTSEGFYVIFFSFSFCSLTNVIAIFCAEFQKRIKLIMMPFVIINRKEFHLV